MTSLLSEVLMFLFVGLGVSFGVTASWFSFETSFTDPNRFFSFPVLIFRLCSKEPQGSMAVDPTV